MKVFIKTQGCTANQADSEVLAGLLKEAGNELSSEKEADLIIINTCSLKTPTETALFDYIHKAKVPLIIAGCFPLAFPDDRRLKKFSLVGSNDFSKIAEAAEKTLKGDKVKFLSREKEVKVCMPRVRVGKIAKIQIAEGCLGNCSFCAGKLSKGDLFSYLPEAILGEIKKAISEGCTRIYLCSHDNGCYGLDINTNLIELVKKALAVQGNFRIRIGMMNPQYALKFLDKLVEIYKNPKVLEFLHIPVQSGSDKILKLMNRPYTVADFKKVVEQFRKEAPSVCIATDIIVGFPEETEEYFQDTIKLLEWLKPNVLNVTRFWKRPGIKASEMKQVPLREIKRRSLEITKRFNKSKLAT